MHWVATHRIDWHPPGSRPVVAFVAGFDDLLYQADEWDNESPVPPAWTWDPGRGLLLDGEVPRGVAELRSLRATLPAGREQERPGRSGRGDAGSRWARSPRALIALLLGGLASAASAQRSRRRPAR
jgi:hypothetical protein